MKINALAPWNWLKKEDELQSVPVSVRGEGAAREPFRALDQIHNDMDRLFGEFFRGFSGRSLLDLPFPSVPAQTEGWLRPNVDISSTKDEYTIHVELPGVDEKDVHVELTGDTLRISGAKKQEKENKERNYYSMERSYGSFQRVLALPEDARRDDISAAFKQGVMTITIPRQEGAQSDVKQIPVKAT